jgi:hypothetical protein
MDSQIEFHPYVYHADNMRRMVSFCQDEDIMVQGYSPLGPLVHAPGGPVDPVVKKVASECAATEAQVLLRWAADYSGGGVVTWVCSEGIGGCWKRRRTSRNDERRKEQLEAFTKVKPLSNDQLEDIAEAGQGLFFRHFQKSVWDAAEP